MEELLIHAGLTKLQAQVYIYLVANGATLPSQLTAKLQITRTNAYKVLEALEKIGLVSRQTNTAKIMFVAEDPITLRSLVAEKRNAVTALERNVNDAMQQLRKSYTKNLGITKVRTETGREAIRKAYEDQAELHQPIYFFSTRADVPFMSYETMHNIRVLQGNLVPQRYGITPDVPEATINPSIDQHTKLTRTWSDEKNLTAPVEWSVAGNDLVMQIFEGEGRTVVVQDELVAESFRQLWHILDKALRDNEDYDKLPRKARRTT